MGKDPMAKSKTPNERIMRAYIDFLRQAMGRSEASLRRDDGTLPQS
jgi:hypothetical protein